MRAIVLADGPQLVDLPRPELEDGWVCVRISVAAISGLDLDVIQGRLDFGGTPGNAFVGVVEEAQGTAARRLIGRRVLGRGTYGCGECDVCTNGMEHRCRDRCSPGRWGAAGAHAEFIALPARAVVPVHSDLTDEAAAVIPLLAGIYAGIARASMPEWTNVLVIGDGGAGLLAAVAFASAGYTLTVRGKHGNRFDLLRRHNINFNLVNDDSEVEGARPGRYGPALMSYPYVVEASGHASGWQAAVELVSPGGTVFMLTSGQDGVPRPVHRVQQKNARVIGLREGPLEAAMEIVARGLFDPTCVISRILPLEEALQAYRRLAQGDEWIVLLRTPDRS
jgi:threonine dehydrogenase-like Zn-dependent dehydrogenase